VEVGPAQPGGGDPNEQVMGTERGRLRNLLELEWLVVRVEAGGPHLA
jgi:hypothetical protein